MAPALPLATADAVGGGEAPPGGDAVAVPPLALPKPDAEALAVAGREGVVVEETEGETLGVDVPVAVGDCDPCALGGGLGGALRVPVPLTVGVGVAV